MMRLLHCVIRFQFDSEVCVCVCARAKSCLISMLFNSNRLKSCLLTEVICQLQSVVKNCADSSLLFIVER